MTKRSKTEAKDIKDAVAIWVLSFLFFLNFYLQILILIQSFLLYIHFCCTIIAN